MIDHASTEDAIELARAEALLDALEPDPRQAHDPVALRRIGFAVQSTRDADVELRDAVAAARAEGYTWAAIGITLGTSRQAAQARFGSA